MCALSYKTSRFFFLTVILFFLSGTIQFAFSQKFLALDVYKLGEMKRIRFYEKDQLTFRFRDGRKFFTHTIVRFEDSTIIFDAKLELTVSEIECIRVDRSTFVTHGLSHFLTDIGIGFIVLDSFNNLLNKEAPVVKTQTLKEGIPLIISGLIIKRMMIRKYRIGERRKLKIIDGTM